MKVKRGVEFTETDTPAPTKKKKSMKYAETSLFAMLCSVHCFYALALSILPVEERGN